MISNNSKPDLRKSSVKYISCVFAIYTILSLPGSFALNCDSVVRVESREILSYLGNVTFRAPTTVQGGKWTLNMKTTYPFSFLGGWDVEVTSDPTKGVATFHGKEDATVYKGDIVSFRFRIHYGTVSSKKIPYVKHLQWKKSAICEGHLFSSELMRNEFQRRVKYDRFKDKKYLIK